MEQKRRLFFTNLFMFTACLCVLFIGFLAFTLSATREPVSVDDYLREFGGNPSVYERLLASNDCAELQSQFDLAYQSTQNYQPGTPQNKWSTGYMKAADQRMKQIGCYSSP